jgi:hypothetical protein
MTQLIFKDKIDQSKMDVLLGMLDSWGVEAEVQMPAPPPPSARKKVRLLRFLLGCGQGVTLTIKSFGRELGAQITNPPIKELLKTQLP